METSKLNDRQLQAVIAPELNDQTTASELLLIDLDLLDDNPYQPRAERDELKAAQLRESIGNQGQLQPILVRRAGARWQIIFGHGRVEALRKLRNEATTDAMRSSFSKVRAEQRTNVSDDQMLLLGLLENIQRDDISPLDCAAALIRLRSLRPQLDTNEAIAQEVGLDTQKVGRLLRLHAAPSVIKDAVSKGMNVAVAADPEESELASEESQAKTTQRRRLDASSALELTKLHAYWTETSTPEIASREGTADERMGALIKRVLTQEWGVRRVHALVEKLCRGEADSSEASKSPATKGRKEAVPFKVNGKKLVIFHSRLGAMTEAQRGELRSVLEPIWKQVGGQLQAPPQKGFAHWAGDMRSWHRHSKELFQACRKLATALVAALKAPPPGHFPPARQLPSNAGQPPPTAGQRSADAPPLPANAAQPPSKDKPAALLPTGKPETDAKPGLNGQNGSQQHLGA